MGRDEKGEGPLQRVMTELIWEAMMSDRPQQVQSISGYLRIIFALSRHVRTAQSLRKSSTAIKRRHPLYDSIDASITPGTPSQRPHKDSLGKKGELRKKCEFLLPSPSSSSRE
ncbi:hypothetical protein TNCV_1166461 [Trichonephila clavipes]|uniref:Uncharacterized protein n=1 Tax=Trichonephila clavipes TaxID=2585209 RepID=A0A8X6T8K6_TRICX|nr:hypothetical protein TNCV_1166461 [Trichonephila clavipes]